MINTKYQLQQESELRFQGSIRVKPERILKTSPRTTQLEIRLTKYPHDTHEVFSKSTKPWQRCTLITIKTRTLRCRRLWQSASSRSRSCSARQRTLPHALLERPQTSPLSPSLLASSTAYPTSQFNSLHTLGTLTKVETEVAKGE